MNRREFSDLEWRTLLFAPFWSFQCVAGIDSHIDAKERDAFRDFVEHATEPEGTLGAIVLNELRAEFDGAVSTWNADLRSAPDGLKEAAAILLKVAPTDATPFGSMLMEIGVRVAGASGGGMFAGPIGMRERIALRGMAAVLGVDPAQAEQSARELPVELPAQA
jgi:hypothetical protein